MRTAEILARIEDLAVEDGVQDARTLACVESAARPGDGVFERADDGHVLLHPEYQYVVVGVVGVGYCAVTGVGQRWYVVEVTGSLACW